jgi:hypothetical protein
MHHEAARFRSPAETTSKKKVEKDVDGAMRKCHKPPSPLRENAVRNLRFFDN